MIAIKLTECMGVGCMELLTPREENLFGELILCHTCATNIWAEFAEALKDRTFKETEDLFLYGKDNSGKEYKGILQDNNDNISM
jgi:hypothetical protein